jgi:hypothetical protein
LRKPILCATGDHAGADYPRSADLVAVVAIATSIDTEVGMEAVVSTDAGATWSTMGVQAMASPSATGAWTNVRLSGSRELAVAESTRFGVRLVETGASGAGALDDVTCRLRVHVGPQAP